MCGIAGWVDWERDLRHQQQVLRAMADALAHRGPDAEGAWVSARAGLVHRRLIVIDPEGGVQPMVRTKGEQAYVLVYNGELYNTAELQHELTARGHRLLTRSDTEALLLSYLEWGPACVERLNGIFAFAIWDAAKEELFLARDRLGVKPLFFAQRGSSFLFASELKSLLAHPAVEPEIDAEGLAEIFVMGPSRTPGHGVFRHVRELKPGWQMFVSRHRVLERPYWRLESAPHPDDFPTTVARVRELVQDAVERQLISDVPICTLLSGGLDSSTITAFAAGALTRDGRGPLHTWSIDYVDNDRYFRPTAFQPNPDAPWVARVSNALGTVHHTVFIDTPDLVAALRDAVVARDLPGMADVDASLLLFSRAIKEKATVGLSGECADEVFGGYPWFYREEAQRAKTFPWMRNLPARIRLFSRELVDLVQPETYLARRYQEALDEVPRLPGEPPQDAKVRELFYLNLTRWMPTLLDRKDRMSMAAGLELRVPFCDHRIVEYLWNVPWAMKFYQQREKGLLRHALAGVLPASVLWRKKSPYPKTHHPLYWETVKRLVLSILEDPASPLRPFVNATAIREWAEQDPSAPELPLFGQLMGRPQFFAYLVQVDHWMRTYNVRVV